MFIVRSHIQLLVRLDLQVKFLNKNVTIKKNVFTCITSPQYFKGFKICPVKILSIKFIDSAIVKKKISYPNP